jgi:predicted nucleotide-binding protein (sugar kinase/HSP70/actin superfamily)
MRIGIPRTLWYWTYGPFWEHFFTRLGLKVVTSGRTTACMVNQGVAACVSEACLPIKVFFGHVQSLAERVDLLFLPRLVCLYEDRVFCPKFLGLPDLIRHSGLTLPPMLDVRLDRRTGRCFLLRTCLEIGRRLEATGARVAAAFIEALRVQAHHRRGLLHGELPARMRPRGWAAARTAGTAKLSEKLRELKVALLGYPYLVFDDHLNLGLFRKLSSLGVGTVTAESVPERALRAQNRAFPKRPFWAYSDLIARAGYHFLGPGSDEVDGVIHLTAFACGPDAVVDKMLELEAERRRRPFLSLTLDEQSGEAGYVTRLEAFVDMLRRRKLRCREVKGVA